MLLILLIYSNTFHASWQFDDKPNIVDNQRLHLTELSPTSLKNTIFVKGEKNNFYRPLPMLSLAINWYLGQGNTFGYHLINTAIHATIAFLLYLTTFSLFLTPKLKDRYGGSDVHFIALLTAVLWAVNPIQIQAVTYIVQRMAAMAAMYYLLAIYLYIKARLARRNTRQALFYMGCLGSFLCALLSKENAAILPLSLGLVEVVFFQDANITKKIKKYFPALAIAGIVLILIVSVLFKTGAFNFLFRAYPSRPFTLVERLLTEPRIVLFYISQIFYPVPARLSITHDIIVSTSLLSPWTTLPAILTILLIMGIAVWQIKRHPLVAFSILFFFINHVVESTILPLELIFEHRNYLPSFFIFLPVAMVLMSLFNYYKSKNRSMYTILSVFVTLVIMGLGCFTYIRNRDWRTETSLWQDAMKKAPGDARPVSSLAIQLAWGAMPTPLQYDVALAMFQKALVLTKAQKFLISDIFNNIGIIYYHRGEYQKSVEAYQKGLEIDPSFFKMRYDLISSLIMMGKWEEGAEEADRLIADKKIFIKPDYFKLKGFILLWQNQPEEALSYFRKALEMEPNNKAVLLNTGVALGLMGDSNNAEFF